MELLIGLLILAAFLALVAVYYHYTDPTVIDEEEEAAVERETPEEHAQARLREQEMEAQEAVVENKEDRTSALE